MEQWMRIKYTALVLGTFLSQTNLVYSSGSMCDYLNGKCVDSEALLGSKSNLDTYFEKWDGYHSGNNEQEIYKPEQVIWNDTDQTVSLLTQAETVDGHPFVSGAIRTKGKYTITKDSSKQAILRGGVEVTAKIPYGYGRWPAVWMMPYYDTRHIWPSGMEIDILEFMSPPFEVLGTIHYGLEVPGTNQASWNYNNDRNVYSVPAESIDDEWHKYGFEWNVSNSMVALTWYFDGKPYYQIEMNKNNDKYTALTRNIQNGQTNNLFCQTDKCPTKYGVSLEEAAYQSFQNGFFGDQGDSEGYYLILNMAVGGPVSPEPDAKTFPVTEMKISDVHRYIINGS